MDRRGRPFLGWRAWRVADTRAGLRLRSAVYDDDWVPGLALAARCRAGHDAPAAQCSCGIYAAGSAAEAARYLVGRDDPDVVHRVVGLVALTGAVVEHERGWRGESGRPARLWVPSADTNGETAPAADVVAGLAVYQARVELIPAFTPAGLAAAVHESTQTRHNGSHTRHDCGVTLAREQGGGSGPESPARV